MKYIIISMLLAAALLAVGCELVKKVQTDMTQSVENIKKEAEEVKQKFEKTKKEVEKTVEKVDNLVDAIKAFDDEE